MPPETSPTGNLPEQVRGLGVRFRLAGLVRRHDNRAVLGGYVLVTSGISVALLSGLAAITDQPFVFPSLGPTAFVVFFAALTVQAAPRNVVSGHLIGVLAGYLGLVIFGLTAVPADLEDVTWPRVGAVTVALCLTLSVMIWLGVPHAPAGATTLIVALGLLRTPAQLGALMLAVLLLAAQAVLINRLAGVPYPLWSRSGCNSCCCSISAGRRARRLHCRHWRSEGAGRRPDDPGRR